MAPDPHVYFEAFLLAQMQRLCLQCRKPASKIAPREGTYQLPTPVFLPGEFHRQRSLVDYSLWGCTESNMMARLTHIYFEFFFFSRTVSNF